ncbi:hypothetical protein I5M27_07140 [Adhaeribacter sp. BT258]|uniref:J domain-containing protein n=1 Tax=Adhaeribacter terrigena TaxID=2793070 RepID=A0ABS1C2G2_9BACT|nr:hypothetical protein [Adhaeribacter terrigena]MBK0402755.1 hypothetical protein [Adhaeribacter terrigena]
MAEKHIQNKFLMLQSVLKAEDPLHQQIQHLEKALAELEKELATAETAINVFSAQLRSQLQPQIRRIQELTAVYKKLKADKKAKRLEQKKKGKNYRETSGLKQTATAPSVTVKPTPENQQELKRLYKEAIRHVHPDKFAGEDSDKTGRATEVTMQLIDVYESGDLEELKGFYEYIISGNAMSHIPYQPETIADPAALLVFLRKKQEELFRALQEIKNSELYHVLQTYPEPLTFVHELRQQFEQKILQLQKRTRKAKI